MFTQHALAVIFPQKLPKILSHLRETFYVDLFPKNVVHQMNITNWTSRPSWKAERTRNPNVIQETLKRIKKY